ncbi:MAG: DpnII family type II restriction endonuclease [Chloroflexota bacterium]|nr:DpnII family type II restriction endonuclease [Chloroflexota bacterium]
MTEARKVSFQEAWDSSSVFFVDDDLEQEINDKVEVLLETAKNHRVSETAQITVADIANFLGESKNALDVILKDVGLSQEKFMRIISLLRKLGRIPGGFNSEWGIGRIRSNIIDTPDFAHKIATLLVDGKRDEELVRYIPRYYLDLLNYREIKGSSQAARRVRYKQSLAGTYGGRKGYQVEVRIQRALDKIKDKHGVGYDKGRSRMIETDIDFAIPNTDDPWIVIMSSFQETTSSGQTTKAKDMRSAYEHICHQNSRYGENRVFVNFVDGGGWLARKRDLERLVEHCHYFINLEHLNMLEAIVLKHVPEQYFQT